MSKEGAQMSRFKVEAVLEKMNEKHITIEKFCREIGVSKQTFYNYCREPKKFCRKLDEIIEILDVSVNEIYDDGRTPKSKLDDFDFERLFERSGLTLYEIEIADALAKCLWDNEQVTTDGKCFCSIGQISYWMTHNKHLKQPQADEIMQALESLSRRQIENEPLIQIKFSTGKIRNQPATIVTYNFARILTQMFKTLNWYEYMPLELKGVKKIAADGSLKTWNLTKSRIEIQTSIYIFVSSYTRAKNSGRPISNKKSYKVILKECEYDNYEALEWNVKNRKKKDIAVILDWLAYNNVIGSWEEYTNRGRKNPDGIQLLGV